MTLAQNDNVCYILWMFGEYSTGQLKHSGYGETFHVQTSKFIGDFCASHEGLEILIADPAGGSRDTIINFRGKEHSLIQGKALLYNAQEEHTEIIKASNQNYFAVVFNSHRLKAFLGPQINPIDLVFKDPLLSSRNYSLVLEFSFWMRRMQLDELSMEAAFDGILTEIFSSCSHSIHLPKLYPERSLFLSRQASRLVLKNYLNPEFSLNTLESELGVTRFHLIRTFKNYYGMTPHQLLLKMRLARAKSLLSKTGKKIIDIAFECGFDDLSTFNKAFKRVFFLPPHKFSQSVLS